MLNKINEMKQQAYSREEKIRKGPLDIQKYDLLLRVKELINVIDQGLIDETNKD